MNGGCLFVQDAVPFSEMQSKVFHGSWPTFINNSRCSSLGVGTCKHWNGASKCINCIGQTVIPYQFVSTSAKISSKSGLHFLDELTCSHGHLWLVDLVAFKKDQNSIYLVMPRAFRLMLVCRTWWTTLLSVNPTSSSK